MDVLLLHAGKDERDVIRDGLTKEGISVTESQGGFEMLENMSKFKKDAVVLDYETWRRNKGVYRYFGVEKVWIGIPIVVVGKKRADIFKEQAVFEKATFLDKNAKIEDITAALKKHAVR